MGQTPHDEFSQFPVESIARFLTVCGHEDPTLLRRSRMPPALAALERIRMRLHESLWPPTPPPPHTDDASDQSAYLEELVSIAVASARQAEDAAREARATGTAARRRMFAISAFGAIGILTGIAGIAGTRFGLDIFPSPPTGGNEFTMADPHQAAEPHAVVSVQPPPASAIQPAHPQPADDSPRDVAILPRTAQPSLAAAAAQDAPADLTALQAVEATLHDNAARAATERAPAPVVALAPPDQANNSAIAVFVAPLPVPPKSQMVSALAEPRRSAPSALASARVAAITVTTSSRLVAAVQALEALTDPAGERGTPP
jgi:hypothetical protein